MRTLGPFLRVKEWKPKGGSSEVLGVNLDGESKFAIFFYVFLLVKGENINYDFLSQFLCFLLKFFAQIKIN